MSDEVDDIVRQWQRERPDLDLSAMALLGRLGRLAVVLQPAIERVFEQHGLRQGEFDVLAALRRAGRPYTLTPSTLSAMLMLSRAGMTNRLDRLETDGLVHRRMDPEDRRSFLVSLTEAGLEVVDAALTEHIANEIELISVLSPAQRDALDDALRTLLAAHSS